MPNDLRVDSRMANATIGAHAPLKLDSIVCSQMELKRNAASFSRRRSTMCRRPTPYIPSPPTSTISVSISPSHPRTSTATLADLSLQLMKSKKPAMDGRRSRASSIHSAASTTLRNSTGERQSLVSMFYWDPSRSTSVKKVGLLLVGAAHDVRSRRIRERRSGASTINVTRRITAVYARV